MKQPDLKTQILADLQNLNLAAEQLKFLQKKKAEHEEALKPIIFKVCHAYEKAWGYKPAIKITSVNLDHLPGVGYVGYNSETDFDGEWSLDFLFDEREQEKEWKSARKNRLKAEKLKADEILAKTKKKAESLRKEIEKLESKQNLKKTLKEAVA